MKFPFYTNSGKQNSQTDKLPESPHSRLIEPDKYLADSGLIDACNVALLLGQPLLLTGEPGTGKTLFAYSLAWELGLGEPLKFETKSTSTARDLFYTYDALRRFRDAQSGTEDISVANYLTYNALGQAILNTLEPTAIQYLVSPGFEVIGKQRSVVLVDEIDKAPRDFPNDILNEIEMMRFRLLEMGNQIIEGDPALRPIIVLTSNSEKDLPDAFLRRSAFYHIPFPNRERLAEIVTSRLGKGVVSNQFLDDALSLFTQLRERSSGLRKLPSTAELLGWLIALRQMGDNLKNPLQEPTLARRTLSVLVKTTEDQFKAQKIIETWYEQHKK